MLDNVALSLAVSAYYEVFNMQWEQDNAPKRSIKCHLFKNFMRIQQKNSTCRCPHPLTNELCHGTLPDYKLYTYLVQDLKFFRTARDFQAALTHCDDKDATYCVLGEADRVCIQRRGIRISIHAWISWGRFHQWVASACTGHGNVRSCTPGTKMLEWAWAVGVLPRLSYNHHFNVRDGEMLSWMGGS